MPKTTDQEKSERLAAMENATKYAIEVPFKVMKVVGLNFLLMVGLIQFG